MRELPSGKAGNENQRSLGGPLQLSTHREPWSHKTAARVVSTVPSNTKNYVSFQSSKAIYRDQSYLASFGQYGRFLVQFRYDEIPHIYSNTTRTLFTQTSPGTYVYPALIRQTLQATSSTNLPSVINTQLVPQYTFLTPQIIRRGGTASVSYDMTPHWNFNAMYFRESQRGDRPIGLIMNSSPSASATSGFGMELPEPIRYYNIWCALAWTMDRRAGPSLGHTLARSSKTTFTS
jgi:Putative outer membrane beta-barrel porin, MtrB/PioB